jgi:hypothetical protein
MRILILISLLQVTISRLHLPEQRIVFLCRREEKGE